MRQSVIFLRGSPRIVVPIVAPPGVIARATGLAEALYAACARHGRDALEVEIVVVPAEAALPPEARRAIVIVDPADPAATRSAIATAAGTKTRLVQLAPAPAREPGAWIVSASGTQVIDRLARASLGTSVGVALGAGGTRGFAHVGVLEALRAHGIPIDYIAGTSIGAVVGTLWAYGHPADEIMTMCGETRRYLLAWTFPLRSLLSNRGIRGHIERSADGRTFEDSPIPLGAVAADLRTGERVLFRHGKLAPAILASSSIPVVFPPVELDGRLLADGGLCEPVPTTSVAELGADVVIGVNLAARAELSDREPVGMMGALLRSSEIMQAVVNEHSARHADVLIAPALRSASLFKEFELAEEYRRAGRAAVAAELPKLRELLPWTVTA